MARLHSSRNNLLTYMDAPGLPSFQLVSRTKVKIAPVHPDFSREHSLSLMGSAGPLPKASAHSKVLCQERVYANHGLTCHAITA
jgi:hypothetical protein